MKTNAKVINCHELGIRKTPWIPELDQDLIGTIKVGESLKILDNGETCFSWNDKEFIKVQTPNGSIGYALKACLEITDE